MIELVVLVAAVVLLAVALHPLLERMKWAEIQAEWERERRRRMEREYLAGLYAGFAASRPSAHAILTGITS